MRTVLAAVAMATLLAACGEDAGAPVPTPLATPTPPEQSVAIYVLSPQQVPQYARSSGATLNAGAVADQKSDPGLAKRLVSWGFIHGASAAYGRPPNVTDTPFTDLTSDAFLFSNSAGAVSFYTDEANRINTPPAGGTLTGLSGLPRQHVDTMLGLVSDAPPQNGDAVDRAFVVLMRTGRVVTEVFARGASATGTTLAAFTPLVSAEQSLLARSPNG